MTLLLETANAGAGRPSCQSWTSAALAAQAVQRMIHCLRPMMFTMKGTSTRQLPPKRLIPGVAYRAIQRRIAVDASATTRTNRSPVNAKFMIFLKRHPTIAALLQDQSRMRAASPWITSRAILQNEQPANISRINTAELKEEASPRFADLQTQVPQTQASDRCLRRLNLQEAPPTSTELQSPALELVSRPHAPTASTSTLPQHWRTTGWRPTA